MAFSIEKTFIWNFVSRGKFGGQLQRPLIFILFLLIIALCPQLSLAVADFGTAGVLPVGRHQVTFRFGNVSGIQDKFNSFGTLQTPSRMNQRFDNKFLMGIPEIQELAKALDGQLLPSQKPSEHLDLGHLEFEGAANVSYFVPQIARGMTSNWSLGIAIPIIQYKSDIRAKNGGHNNAKELLGGATNLENAGELNAKYGAGAEMMAEGPARLFNYQLANENYKSISGRDNQFLGDIVLGSSLRLFNTPVVDFYLLNQLTLPTGPKDDPDDLIDFSVLGKTNFQTTLFTNYNLVRWLELGVGLSYTIGIKDDIVKRVPRSESDQIPAASTKETLDKDPGNSIGVQVLSVVKVSDYLHVGAGYEMIRKNGDRYYGQKNSRYDLLERNTESEAGIARFKISYSTVDGFVKGLEAIPYSLTYAFADHMYGTNIERELTHELLMKFYF